METNKIYQGDCLELMKKLDNESIDLIIADYPFNCQDGRKDYIEFVKSTSDEFFRILKEGGNLVVINNPSNIFKTSEFYKQFKLRNTIALIRKGSIRPAQMLGFQHNYCLLLTKGDIKIKWNGAKKNHDINFPTDVMKYQNGYRGKGKASQGKVWHPQAIPLDLTKLFIKLLSHPTDLVLDCFMGSGTTALACKELNRTFIGFEISPEYVNIANKRIAQTKLI